MYDIAIIGGGIIGLTTAYECQQRFPDKKIIVLEKEAGLVLHQTGNNSGVIHSGIYYKPGSLKATNCRNGIKKLLDFCDNNAIPYELSGKLIVATTEGEIPVLNNLYERGLANGLTDLKLINADECTEIEPHVFAIKGIHSPSTGIIDYRTVCSKITQKIVDNGGEIKFNSKVINVGQKNKNNIIETHTDKIESEFVINCSGLYSDRVAQFTQNVLDLKIIPFRGEYYKLKEEKRHLVKNLIYPVPDPKFPFLGVHFTRRIDGAVEAGPNAVLAFAREGYKKFDINFKDLAEIFLYPAFWKLGKQYWKIGSSEMLRSFSKTLFISALQKLIPEISKQDITTGGSGVRAQALTNGGQLLDDFKIVRNGKTIHVLNAPSPAATSAFAIAENIVTYFDT